MTSKKMLILTCLLGIGLTIILYFYSSESVAVHFNTQGIPNSWMNRNINLIFWIITYVFMTGLYLGIQYSFDKIPVKFFNIPNRSYWLHPDRRKHTFSLTANIVFKLGVACNLFFISLELIIFKTNMQQGVQLNTSITNILIGIFLAYVILWMIQLFKIFKKAA